MLKSLLPAQNYYWEKLIREQQMVGGFSESARIYSSLYDYGGDNAMMRNAMEIALSRADIVITSGGLGATQGDIT